MKRQTEMGQESCVSQRGIKILLTEHSCLPEYLGCLCHSDCLHHSQSRRAGDDLPRIGAAYYFLKRSPGSFIASLSLCIKLFIYPLGIAAQTLLISTYIIQPFYAWCPAPQLPKICLALATLWSLGLLNMQGVLTVAGFQTLSTLAKTIALCFISLTGIVLIETGKKKNVAKFENAFDPELPGALQIAEALLTPRCHIAAGICVSSRGSKILLIEHSCLPTWAARAIVTVITTFSHERQGTTFRKRSTMLFPQKVS
ncbi:hypothetical protein HPG69_011493 [Diceros bicornis minor]|uniref:Uncharacterized protein n=1 Tax=Diceros bicornis minor TaxID=77932 RepID=A0A7J7FEC3_DICBM|nr:hypothetical protein HPG69_011493 [Diceros bicornis minor]